MTPLLVVFVLCFIPLTYLLVGYGLLTRWYSSLEGWVLFSLIGASWGNFALGLLTLALPDLFGPGQPLEWTRWVGRIPIILVLWGLVIVFVRAQKRTDDRRIPRRSDRG